MGKQVIHRKTFLSVFLNAIRECTESSHVKNYYQCLNDRVEQRMKNDLKCNTPPNVVNKVNEDMPLCTTTEDFKEGITMFPDCPNISRRQVFSLTVIYDLEHDIFPEEMVLNPMCKPDCESWSYQVDKNSHYTKKGDFNLKSNCTFSCIR